jgi:hypothetical protein
MSIWQNLVSPTGKGAAIGLVSAIFPILMASGVKVPDGLSQAVVGGVSALLLFVGVTFSATTLHRQTPPGIAPAPVQPPQPPV